MKIKLVNNSLVTVGGKLPGSVFSVNAVDSKTPVETFWRNRLKDDDGIALHSEPKTGSKPELDPKPETPLTKTKTTKREVTENE